MKKIISLMVALMPIIAFAQVRVATPGISNEAVPYDSTYNVVSDKLENLKGLIGQELYLATGITLHENDFSTDPSSKKRKKINLNQLYGKLFTVIDACTYKTDYGMDHNWLKLRCNDTNEVIYYDYYNPYLSFPFVVMGYKAKLENKYKSRKFLVLFLYKFLLKDFNTGKKIDYVFDEAWEFAELIISTETNKPAMLFKNERGNYAVLEEQTIVDKSEYDKAFERYGEEMCEAAKNHSLKKGMPKFLVFLAKGSPDLKGNVDTTEYWVYQYGDSMRTIYFENGVVESWD